MKLYLIIACLLLSFYAKAQNIQEVHITNIEKKKGTLYVGWYDNKKAFMKPQQTVFVKLIDVDNQDEVKAVFDKIPAGKYAISVFLDENNNKDLDLNLVGIPQEKYGFSNGTPAMRPATFNEAQIEVNGEKQTIPIKLK